MMNDFARFGVNNNFFITVILTFDDSFFVIPFIVFVTKIISALNFSCRSFIPFFFGSNFYTFI